ncbi:MAG: putative baseplate assembly protein, partial [Pseudonocardiaceae bacterium]
GGPDGTGWPFGRPVQSGEVFAVLQRLPGVEMVEDVRLFGADPVTGTRGEATSRLDLGEHALVFSYDHQIRVTPV